MVIIVYVKLDSKYHEQYEWKCNENMKWEISETYRIVISIDFYGFSNVNMGTKSNQIGNILT